MIKVDLITGFLGSGKTTFIKSYAKSFMNTKIGIIENDFGAINVDRLLLKNIESDNIEIEQVVGGNIIEDYRRRLRTKLISMAMRGFNRIIIEPSGIFNALEFFDILADDTLSNWYEPGNVFTIIDCDLLYLDNKESRYLLCTEIANSSKLFIRNRKDNILETLNMVLKEFNTSRVLTNNSLVELDNLDYNSYKDSGYFEADYDKLFFNCNDIYKSLFIMNKKISLEKLNSIINTLFTDNSYGEIIRIKGFINKNDNIYYEINATKTKQDVAINTDCQEVIIVIGNNLNEEKINNLF